MSLTAAKPERDYASRWWILRPVDLTRSELENFGRHLDARPRSLKGQSVTMAFAEQFLVVRSKDGSPAKLKANAVQKAFEIGRGE